MAIRMEDLNKLHGSKLTVVYYRKGFNWMMKVKGYKGFCGDMQHSNAMPVGRPAMEHAFHLECNKLAVREGAWQPDKPGQTSLKARTIELMFSVACDMIYARPHRKDGRKRKERKVPQHYKRLKYYKDGTPRGNGGSWNAQTWWEEQAKRAWKQRGIVLDITSPFQRPENSYTFRPIDTIIGSMGNQHLMIDSYSLDDLAEQTKLLAESAANHSSDVETPSDDGNNDEDEEFIRNLDANNQASLAAEGISLGMNWEMNDDDLIYMDDDDDVKGWLDDMDSDEAEDGDGDETDASMDLSE